MAQLMPLPLTVSCFSKIQFGFTSLVPAHPGSPGQRAIKRVCVCASHKVVSTNVRITLFYSVHLFSFSFKLHKYMYELILTEFLESILIHAMLFKCICSKN